jgi:DHA1 family multidrug resistance protein-like MFS transporter
MNGMSHGRNRRGDANSKIEGVGFTSCSSGTLSYGATSNSLPRVQFIAGESSTAQDGSSDPKVVVDKSSEFDPIDPRNWPLLVRSKNILILSLLIFVQGWASSADPMANSSISSHFGVSKVAKNFSQALYLFGIGCGSLFMGPLSEKFGRNLVYLNFSLCYLLFVFGCAITPTFGGQLACRYFAGLSASGTLAMNRASVQDQFRPVKRAFVFPIIAWTNVAGTTRLLGYVDGL